MFQLSIHLHKHKHSLNIFITEVWISGRRSTEIEMDTIAKILVLAAVTQNGFAGKFDAMTWNVGLLDRTLAGNVPGIPNNRVVRRDAIIQQLKTSDADLICLQEVVLGEDVEEFKNQLANEYPHTFSPIHFFDGTLPPQVLGIRAPPCEQTRLGAFLTCVVQHSCTNLFKESGYQCILAKCLNEAVALVINDGQDCVSCIYLTEPQSIFSRCTTAPANVGTMQGLRKMNPMGLLMLSKERLANQAVVEIYPGSVENLQVTGYLQTTFDDKQTVICTQLNPHSDTFGEFELAGYFTAYNKMNEHEVTELIERFSQLKNVLLMGNFGVGPDTAIVDGVGEDDYDDLANNFETELANNCTRCPDNDYNVGDFIDNETVDHIFVTDELAIEDVQILYTQYDVLAADGLPLSDNYAVQGTITFPGNGNNGNNGNGGN